MQVYVELTTIDFTAYWFCHTFFTFVQIFHPFLAPIIIYTTFEPGSNLLANAPFFTIFRDWFRLVGLMSDWNVTKVIISLLFNSIDSNWLLWRLISTKRQTLRHNWQIQCTKSESRASPREQPSRYNFQLEFLMDISVRILMDWSF